MMYLEWVGNNANRNTRGPVPNMWCGQWRTSPRRWCRAEN